MTGNPYPKDFTPQCPHLSWLCEHLDGWQFGEQGLIETVLAALSVEGVAIEYGAGDGVSLPLTIDRIYNTGRKCCLIEIDDQRRISLGKLYPDARIIQSIDWSNGLKNGPQPAVVIIDIDGKDSVVMREMFETGVRPTLLVVEHMDRHFPIGTSIPDVIPEWMLGLQLKTGHAIQDTAETLHAMAAENGYERIGYNRCNSFFVVRERFADLFR